MLFRFPDIGEGLEEGTIHEIYVQEGQAVKAGDLLVSMETDKVTADIPSPRTGVVVKIFGKPGDVIHVGEPLAEIQVEGEAEVLTPAEMASGHLMEEDDDLYEPESGQQDDEVAGVVGTLESAGNEEVMAASEETSSTGRQSGALGALDSAATTGKPGRNVPLPASSEREYLPSGRKVFATPHVRSIAREMGIDIRKITGTGPGGRITREDLEKVAASSSPAEKTWMAQHWHADDVSYEPLTQLRKTIARNMLNSKHNAAHITIVEEVEISELIAIREKYKVKYAERNAKLTYLPFIVKATVLALKQHRIMNAQMDMENNRMIYKNQYNIGIAMDTPEGLVVPVIRNADKLSLFEIAQQITAFADKARERKLTLDDMKGGTFTISNFGSIAGIFGTPVINYPQVGILGIGRIMEQAVVKNHQVVVGNVLGLSLSVDHRVVDGGDTARFMKQIIDHLADPISLMME
ncbi:MAG: dihydrolipoamide acetyltransferase family protein [Paludibacter sp.]|jgi:pyruvate dehydrogenase E2 component (dihydrolipoamide acetyltransferase)|nr:dihydrolipoamide acetyltransferase family protein [Paludibacter sp.]